MSYKAGMIGFMVRTGVRMLALAGFLYVAFFVPLGSYTLYGHVRRIAATDEAEDLTRAVSSLFDEAVTAVSTRVTELRR
jgi:hypothetical protein